MVKAILLGGGAVTLDELVQPPTSKPNGIAAARTTPDDRTHSTPKSVKMGTLLGAECSCWAWCAVAHCAIEQVEVEHGTVLRDG
jgi:hypothetical protein